MNRKLANLTPPPPEWRIPLNLYTDTFVELLKDRYEVFGSSTMKKNSKIEFSLSERLEDGENPNTSPSRYVMVIDPTDNETAVGLLFSLGICDRATTRICYVGDFSDDANDLARSDVVLQVW